MLRLRERCAYCICICVGGKVRVNTVHDLEIKDTALQYCNYDVQGDRAKKLKTVAVDFVK
jgi:hypothetical protein